MTALCTFGKLPQLSKGNTVSTGHLHSEESLHMDFAFLNIVSRHRLLAVLEIVDACSRFLWVFLTSSKKLPIHILHWFIANLRREKRLLTNICVNEDGALARSTVFTTFIHDEAKLNQETTNGYASFLNGNVELPNRTLEERALCMLLLCS
jgi:hypothetical protein